MHMHNAHLSTAQLSVNCNVLTQTVIGFENCCDMTGWGLGRGLASLPA